MKTLSIDESERSREEAQAPRPWIVRVGCAGAPLRASERIPLDDRPRIVLGRRDQGDPNAPMAAPGSERAEIADPWMSSEHAEVALTDEGWLLKDLGSSNGTLI